MNLDSSSIRLELRKAAGQARELLADSVDLVRGFLLDQQNDDGGFRGRTEKSDLYYTLFGLEGLLAIGPSPAVNERYKAAFRNARPFIDSFGDGTGLDFVHLCCLARARASLRDAAQVHPETKIREDSPNLAGQLEQFRSNDGGYNPVAESKHGTAYACFLALGACQDEQRQLRNPAGLAVCLSHLETEDGAWINENGPWKTAGSTNATAAALTILRHLAEPINPKACDWLLARAHPHGGFCAAPHVFIPDLLSTATALHVLGCLKVSCATLTEQCLDYIDSLWTNRGAFHGHWHDEQLDCEYCFYGLLALGSLRN
jgi:prenyltransferase beta subunit